MVVMRKEGAWMILAKEKKWRRSYLFIMILVYGLVIPVMLFEWLVLEGKFPLAGFVIGFALPAMRRNHLTKIRQENN